MSVEQGSIGLVFCKFIQIGFILETQSSHCQSTFPQLSGPKTGLSKINKCYYIFICICSNTYFIRWFHLNQLDWFNWIYSHVNVKKQKVGPDTKVCFQTKNCEKRTLGEDSCLISTPQLNYFLKTGRKLGTGLDFSNISEVLHYEFSCGNKIIISSFSTCKMSKLHLLNMKIYVYIWESYK